MTMDIANQYHFFNMSITSSISENAWIDSVSAPYSPWVCGALLRFMFVSDIGECFYFERDMIETIRVETLTSELTSDSQNVRFWLISAVAALYLLGLT